MGFKLAHMQVRCKTLSISVSRFALLQWWPSELKLEAAKEGVLQLPRFQGGWGIPVLRHTGPMAANRGDPTYSYHILAEETLDIP